MSNLSTHILNSNADPYSYEQTAEKSTIEDSPKPDLKASPKTYIQSHKVELAIMTLALGVIAYLALGKNAGHPQPGDSFPQPNEWTLSGPLNPITINLAGSDKICSFILGLQKDSFFSMVDTQSIEVLFNASLLPSSSVPNELSKVSPFALLIHNNCQAQAQVYKDEILHPDFDINQLTSLIAAAASAHNTPLWEELFLALTENNNLKSMDGKERSELFFNSLARIEQS